MEKYDVFISYKSDERKEAFHIKNSLEADGLTVWMDRFYIPAGSYYVNVIEKNLINCHSLVMLLSSKSFQSKEVKREVDFAISNNIPVFPVTIDNICITEEVQKLFKYPVVKDGEEIEEMYQIETRYTDPMFGEYFVLKQLSQEIYKIKGIEPILDKKRQENRIKNYKKLLNKEYDILEKRWFDFSTECEDKNQGPFVKAISRCGFSTPEPEILYNCLKDEITPYFDLVDSFVNEVVNNVYDGEDMSKELLYSFSDNKLTDLLWISNDAFVKLLKNADLKIDITNIDFLNRIYYDYLNVIKSEAFNHPIVRLLKALKESDESRYFKICNELLVVDEKLGGHQTEWSKLDNISAFIETGYIGTNYRAFQGDCIVDDYFKVYEPSIIGKPDWFDFVRIFWADEVISSNSTEKTREFIYKHPICTMQSSKSKIIVDVNHIYFYMLNRFVATDNLRSIVVFAQETRNSFNKVIDMLGFDSIDMLKNSFFLLISQVETSMKYNGYMQNQIHDIVKELEGAIYDV